MIKYKDFFPREYNRYFEPFLGSGAVFFFLQPHEAVLADVNEELINLYSMMREKPEELKQLMCIHQKKHDKEYYYKIRNTIPSNTVECAGRMLYLNRTCFNGMYRVNQNGDFNVPIGTKNNCIYDVDSFQDYAECLENARFICDDFQNTICLANRGDFVFADPPYAVKNTTGFIKYNNELFAWSDQLRLHKALLEARSRGVKIALTNIKCKEIEDMYKKDGFYVHVLDHPSNIAGLASGRGRVKELLITSYRKPRKKGKNDE